MSRGLKSGRVLLDDRAIQDILDMEDELKDEATYVHLNPSKLASWIISRYRKTAFSKEKVMIQQSHFNHQKYLKEALKDVKNEEDLRVALSKVMKNVGGKKRGRKRKGDQRENQTTD